MKQIKLLGITLRDYTLRESMKLVNSYLNNGALNTISYISTQILVEAAENPEQQEWIESMDLTISGELDILRAAAITSRNRFHEVENDEFMKEFLKKIVRNRKTIFLLSDSQGNLENLQNEIREYQENIRIVGSYILDELSGRQDSLINEINDIVPTVIISCMPYPYQEQLMYENKIRINSEVWIALPGNRKGKKKKKFGSGKISLYFDKRMFGNRINKYKDEMPD
ncbi:MAG TPA: WecB/TagA/CpsF family glycosyltransferase [Lachnospiraceae bacterium]|nr:WecB/TagA/CpsF family glycosyltransferase [Lachnospiraceae bacterium]